MWEKIKLWFSETGLTNVVYLGAAIAGKILLGSNLLLGAGIGIFVYINWNVIRKLWTRTASQFRAKKAL